MIPRTYLLVLSLFFILPLTLGVAQLQSRADLLEIRYHEDRAKGLKMLNQRYIAIYEKAMKAAMDAQQLDEANSLKAEIDRLSKEIEELEKAFAVTQTILTDSEATSIVGKTARFASNRDPNFTIRIAFLEEGKAVWTGLGNVRVDYVYEAGDKPLEFIAWNPTQSTKARGWKVTMPHEGIDGSIVNLGSNYTTEAKIVPSRSEDVGR